MQCYFDYYHYLCMPSYPDGYPIAVLSTFMGAIKQTRINKIYNAFQMELRTAYTRTTASS